METQQNLAGVIGKINDRIDKRRERHKQDVEIVRRDYPEVAEFLTEMTKEFGKCEYRVTMKQS